ncbi:hypothetical protein LPB19_03525 [Marinobacter salinisoli]|uniref:Uncharacterized protein n=1 Tax=Marinobacter salinisoli TaxID=2769486 RepID=A0ABX7MSY3_9GAMM|nr:hypothetical protein [Marinobacter salinisoli]QSP95500.1 hypothetical protein LPB19_03525 [Marinobacter salinisoli]
MKVDGIEETLTNLQIAERQLERSIGLFLDQKDFVSSLTLAGAAEEILGKLLNERGEKHWLDEVLSGALRALGFRRNTLETPEAKKSRKEVSNLANYYKNRLKHYNEDGSITFTVDAEAADMIDRAISNYFKLTKSETGAMERFKELVLLG